MLAMLGRQSAFPEQAVIPAEHKVKPTQREMAAEPLDHVFVLQQQINALTSSHFHIDALTDGLTYTSESGTNYATHVPEPASAVLMAAGLAMVLLAKVAR